MADETTVVETPTPTPAPTTPPATPDHATKMDVVQMARAEYDQWLSEREANRRALEEKERQRIEAEEKAARNAMEKGHFDKAFEKWESLAKEKEARLAREKEEALAAERVKSAAELKAIRDERDRLAREKADNEARARRHALDSEIARALGDLPLVEGAVGDLTELLRPHFTVESDGHSYTPRASDGRSAKDFIAAFVEARSHYKRAGSRGGVVPTPSGLAPRHEGAPDAAPQPKNMGEAAIAQMLATRLAAAANAPMNMGVGMGLRPTQR